MMSVLKEPQRISPHLLLTSGCIATMVLGVSLIACERQESSPSAAPDHNVGKVEHGERRLSHTDMLEAYERGDYEQARELARKHLAPAYRQLVTKGQEIDGAGLQVLGDMLVCENRIPAASRFGGDATLVAWLEDLLLAKRTWVRSKDITDRRQIAGRQRAFKFAAVPFIIGRSEHLSREELEQLYTLFAPELQVRGWGTKPFMSLDELLASRHPPVAQGPKARTPDEAECERIVGAILDYYDGLVLEDVGRLQSATGLNEEKCRQLLDASHEECTRKGHRSIRAVALPDLAPQDLRLRPDPRREGFYSLTVRGIRLEIVDLDGALESKTISKLLILHEDNAGRWTIDPPD